MQPCYAGFSQRQLVHRPNCLSSRTAKTNACPLRQQSASNRAWLRWALRTERRKSSRALNGKGSARTNNEFDRDKAKEESRPHKRTVRTSVKLNCQTRQQAETRLDWQVFNFKNWAAHRSSKRYNRHIKSLLRVRCSLERSQAPSCAVTQFNLCCRVGSSELSCPLS